MFRVFGGENLTSHVNAKVLTPMFLYGNNKNIIELRPPSIKGGMRYWWRAAFCEKNIELLSEEESKLFGSQNIKSPFSIKITESKIKQGRYDMLPYPRPLKKWDSKFNAFMPETNFDLIIKAREKDIYEKATSSLELSFLLGGLGKRSRRGFGGLEILDSPLRDYAEVYASKENFLTNLSEILNGIGQGLYELEGNMIVNTSIDEINFVYPIIKNIKIGEPESNYSELLIRVDKATHDNADKSLGDGEKRMASPVVVRIQKISGKYYPVVIELNAVYPYKIRNESPKENFIRQVLQGET